MSSFVKTNNLIKRVFIYIFLSFLAIIAIFPFYIIVSNSFKTPRETALNPIGLPDIMQFNNYYSMFVESDYLIALKNTLVITFFSIAIIVLIGSLAAYAIARFKFKYGSILYILFISGLILPLNTLLLPLYLIFLNLSLLDSIPNLILLYTAFALPITIFVLTGFFRTIPKELEDAAKIDGCSRLRILFNIFLPLSKGPLVWIIIMNVLYIWNDFVFPLFFLVSGSKKTLIVKMFYFSGQYTQEWNLIFAFITVTVLPIVILFIVFQKYFMSGILAGSVKG